MSVSASYPGGDNYLSWTPNMKTDQDTLVTVEKTEGAGCLLYDVSDLILNGGLSVVAGTPRDSLSAQIEVPQEFDENKFLSVSFQMGDGFSIALRGSQQVGQGEDDTLRHSGQHHRVETL